MEIPPILFHSLYTLYIFLLSRQQHLIRLPGSRNLKFPDHLLQNGLGDMTLPLPVSGKQFQVRHFQIPDMHPGPISRPEPHQFLPGVSHNIGGIPDKRFFPPKVYNNFSESLALISWGFQNLFFKNHPLFFSKTLDKPVKKCGASRP